MELLENHWKAPFGIQNRASDETEETTSPVDRHLIIAFRKNRKESQRRFWARFGVTQSRGSRFESGAEIPPPVSILLGLYLTKTITDSDLGRAERVIYSKEAAAFLSPDQ
ncbi:XRE family transcriptional regulator [Paraburkholderia sp. DHOC27]|uniref:XRE family transcriptional regulator n=1 Tax=Paraburkholderia sp. DHOC27 TaxID=2303330 RepID=UPI000E3BDCAA|nr:XRE family transcriptional regulator [Paraburkholderia sp. DHOC27]RFU48883.1 XRE family transcriptional regulator [Paraburkholderia sp. DHOC27]